MKKVSLFLLAAQLCFFGSSYASDISMERILNDVYNSSTNALKISLGSGSSNTQILYNNSGSIAGDSGLVFDSGSNLVTAGSYAATNTPERWSGASSGMSITLSTSGFNFDTGPVYGYSINNQNTHRMAGSTLETMGSTCKLLLGWYTPITTETDLSGATHDATYISMETTDQGTKGSAWIITPDGSAEYVTVADHNDFSFNSGGASDTAFSMGGIINVADTSGNQTLVAKWDATSGAELREWEINLTSAEKIQVAIYDESANVQTVRLTDSALSTGYHFWTVTYDGAGGATAGNTIKIYVDGILVASTATNNGSYVAMENLATVVSIGALKGTGGTYTDFMTGAMGMTFIDAAELTAAQVWRMYEKTRGFYNL